MWLPPGTLSPAPSGHLQVSVPPSLHLERGGLGLPHRVKTALRILGYPGGGNGGWADSCCLWGGEGRSGGSDLA